MANLNEWVQMWPTPTRAMAKQGANVPDGKRGLPLINAVRGNTFATPTSRDWRSGKASPATHARNARPLSEQIGGSLNPTWVEWLMGFPLGWTVCAAWETRSSRKSRK